jgi:hypothetical protein
MIHFLRRQRYSLMFLAALTLCVLLILHQTLANESAHVQMREDFILLHGQGQDQPAQHLYQSLIQQLPTLSDRSLIDDFQRMVILDLEEKQTPASLLLKYKGAVARVLERRTEERVAQALKRAKQN